MKEMSFADLSAAFKPLEDLAKTEKTFDVSGISVTLKYLNPEEMYSVNRKAEVVKNEHQDEEDLGGFEYLETFKLATLSQSVVQIGSVDFRGVSFIETEEVLPNGQKIKIAKSEAIYKIVKDWPAELRNSLFYRYNQLSEEISAKTEKLFQFEPSTIDSEIERLKKRLSDLEGLKSEQEKPKIPEPESVTVIKESLPVSEEKQDIEPQTTTEKSDRRQPAYTGTAMPAPEPVKESLKDHQKFDFDSSFLNTSDEESMQKAIELENLKALQLMQNPPPEPPKPLVERNLEAEIDEEGLMRGAYKQGGLSGKPVQFRKEQDVLAKPNVSKPSTLVTDAPVAQGINPRFRSKA